MNPLGDIMRALTSGLIHAIRSQATQIAGFKVIVDFSGCSFKKLPHISPTYLWLFAEALQVSMTFSALVLEFSLHTYYFYFQYRQGGPTLLSRCLSICNELSWLSYRIFLGRVYVSNGVETA